MLFYDYKIDNSTHRGKFHTFRPPGDKITLILQINHNVVW